MKGFLHIAIWSILIVLVIAGCRDDEDDLPAPQPEPEMIRGVDLSFLPQMEAAGVTFLNAQNEAQDVLEICRDQGVNAVRIRLWKDPVGQHSSLSEVKALSQRVKALGMKVWLTVHYSDTWADPGNQVTPQQWAGLNFLQLKDSVYAYTKSVVAVLQPDIIQIGNEINPGFLFPEGELATQESQFISLLESGILAVKDEAPETKIMLHYAGLEGAKAFFERLRTLDFDMIGLSYYPLWHGKDLVEVERLMIELVESFPQEVLLAETAYPFTLDWDDWTNNIVGLEEQLVLPSFPATPVGQKRFLERLRQLVKTSGGSGFCYWGAEYVAFDGPQSTEGSPWENQALFDFDFKTLPALEVFQE